MDDASVVEKIWTIGHSTRTIEEFIQLLLAHQIGLVADVRLFPQSRRYPQFNQSNLEASLAQIEIGYVHLPELGGRRMARRDSKNVAWRNASFRGYADYMETDGFSRGITRLGQAVASTGATAMMCAEALWWRCHRALIADYLKVNGAIVVHIIGAGKVEPHPFTSAARVVNGKLSYKGGVPGKDRQATRWVGRDSNPQPTP